MSARAEDAVPPLILITAKATFGAGEVCLMLTVIQERENLWRYSLSRPRYSRLAHGKIIITGHAAALRRAAEICAGGYQPGTVERGLLDTFARDTL
jgi:hypothetical protein